MTVFVKVERAALVGDEMTAHATPLTLSDALSLAFAHEPGAEHIQVETPYNTLKQLEPDAERGYGDSFWGHRNTRKKLKVKGAAPSAV